jgi:DNA polymerase I
MESIHDSDIAQRLSELTKPVQELEEGLLVSATYDGELRVAVLKFYDPRSERVWLWHDNTGHKPYCYTKLERGQLTEVSKRKDVIAILEEEKLDLLSDRKIMVRKIVATDPLAVGGSQTSIREQVKVWEADIKYYENYSYDLGLKMGTYYRVSSGKLIPIRYDITETVEHSLRNILMKNPEEFHPYIKEWAELLSQPLVNFKRIAIDIEVANESGRVPDSDKATLPVIAVSFYNDVEKTVFVLLRDGKNQFETNDYSVIFFEDERELIRAAFGKIIEYPLVITFNGDDFDLRYLYNRAKNLAIPDSENPIQIQRQEVTLKHGIHIDLYKFFTNKSVQVYAFGNKYSEHTLDSIAEAILGKNKIEFEGEIPDLPLEKLASYCLNDSQITYELTSFSGSLVMRLILVFARIAKMPINDVARLGVSNWIKSMLFYEHRRINALIPRSEELEKGSASSQATIKGKKYRGGLVIEPTPGVYFDVSVLDFASLYPSLIKVQNLSYETVNCIHEECRDNIVPDTTHWVCKKRRGITSLVIGSLRDLRVSHYKQLAKDLTLTKEERELYSVVSQGLKVILNAGYGVMGFETFAFYCLPVAEATAALGRYAITKTIEKCKSLGIAVLYSDTDSLFLQKPTQEQISTITRWAETELGVELDLDKVYRYVAFSSRKKNYFGVLQDGTVDIKGLTGKKSQTPEFLKRIFYDALQILSEVKSKEDFERARERIRSLLSDTVSRLRAKKIPIDQLAFNVMMGKPTSRYNETTPQHVKAAQLLEKSGKEVKAGEIISFVKTRSPPYVKPVELASPEEIDVDKYLEYARSMFDQMLDALDFSFDEIMGTTTLDLFWSN